MLLTLQVATNNVRITIVTAWYFQHHRQYDEGGKRGMRHQTDNAAYAAEWGTTCLQRGEICAAGGRRRRGMHSSVVVFW